MMRKRDLFAIIIGLLALLGTLALWKENRRKAHGIPADLEMCLKSCERPEILRWERIECERSYRHAGCCLYEGGWISYYDFCETK